MIAATMLLELNAFMVMNALEVRIKNLGVRYLRGRACVDVLVLLLAKCRLFYS